jgi:hypothetical protein
MRTDDSEQAMVISDACKQHEGGKERECLEEVCGCLVNTIRQTSKRRDVPFAGTGSPAITALPADQVRTGNQIDQPENDAGDKQL